MKQITITYSILLVFSVLLFWLWRMDSPVPSVLNWDIFEHQTVINQIHKGRWAMLPSALTDTFRFDGYTTLFHTILAGAQSIIRVDPLTFWWGAEFVHFLVTVAVSTYIASVFFNQPLAGLIGGLLGATIFESQVAYTSLFLLPQTVSATLGALAIALLASNEKRAMDNIMLVLLFVLSVLFHFIIGGFVLALALIYQFAIHANRRQLIHLTLALALFIPTATFILATTTPLGVINYGEAEVFTHTLAQKLQYALQWYGLFFALIPLGIVMAIRSQSLPTRVLGLLATVSLATLVAPFPYALKFATVGRFFLNAASAFPLLWVIRMLQTRWAKVITTAVITASFTFVFTQNIRLWKAPLLRDDQASEISEAEIRAAEYLKNTYSMSSDTVMLLSDPATQYVLEATSGINSQGGAYASNRTRTVAAKMLTAKSASELRDIVSDISDYLDPEKPDRIVFTASGRYFRWLEKPQKRYDIAYNVWRPEGLTINDQAKLRIFQEKTGLKPIYQNTDIVVFSISTL